MFDPWIGKIPWRRKWQPTPVFLPGKSHGRRNLVGYCPWDCKRVRHWTTKQHWTLQLSRCLCHKNLSFVPHTLPIKNLLALHESISGFKNYMLTIYRIGTVIQSTTMSFLGLLWKPHSQLLASTLKVCSPKSTFITATRVILQTQK